MTNKEQWLARQVEQDKQRVVKQHHAGSEREWITIDGEGWGRDEQGRQYYRFMIAANESDFQMRIIHTDSPALTTADALEWLTSISAAYRAYCKRKDRVWHPPYIGGFALGYDYAHILIDITQEQLEHLLTHQDFESPPTKLTDRYAAKLTAGNLRIFTVKEPNIELCCIWDTFKYYQAAFLKVMGAYATPEQWAIIEAGKNRRNADTDHSIDEELMYCLNECRVHSRAMNDLNRAVHEMELIPRGWFGPGSLASSAMRKHGVKRYWLADSEQPSGLATAALYGYIGGRFETTGHGWLPHMFGHDIRSAYPAGMVTLPCLVHGQWRNLGGDDAVNAMHSDQIAIGLVSWDCQNPPGGWGPYASRFLSADGQRRSNTKSKLPAWPFTGTNWIWNEEFKAGLFLTSSVEIKETWVYESHCSCTPFDWISDYYTLRYKLKEEGNEIGEKVVKLIINSGYGKIAQTIGQPPVPTWIWAGLITQSARAKLLRAISLAPDKCVMVATDAVYSTESLNLDFGPKLGQWDGPDEYGNTLIIQAGFWRDFDNDVAKTRGISKRYLTDRWSVFEELWDEICDGRLHHADACVPIRYSDHIGLQRARQYGIANLGKWTDDAYQDIRFRVDKRPHLVGSPVNGWWSSAPTRTDRVGEQLNFSLEVTVGEQYINENSSLMDKYFIVEQPDAAEWGYTDD